MWLTPPFLTGLSLNLTMNKSDLRSEMHLIRSQISKTEQSELNQQLYHQITQSKLWQDAQSVAIYLAFNNEADVSSLLNTDKLIYLPSIKGNQMQFHLHTQQTVFETLSYGLKQPQYDPLLAPAKIDLYLMPLLAFDPAGNRLGMGGGFYDRYFAQQHNGERAGIAFSCQLVEQLPTDPWDVKLQHIFTEQKHIKL